MKHWRRVNKYRFRICCTDNPVRRSVDMFSGHSGMIADVVLMSHIAKKVYYIYVTEKD